jgi:hypothetical protein
LLTVLLLLRQRLLHSLLLLRLPQVRVGRDGWFDRWRGEEGLDGFQGGRAEHVGADGANSGATHNVADNPPQINDPHRRRNGDKGGTPACVAAGGVGDDQPVLGTRDKDGGATWADAWIERD